MASTASSLNNSFVQKLVMTVILAITFFISASVAVYLSLKGKEVAVPNLVGKSEGEAEQMLSAEGLRLRVRSRTTDEKVQANLISEQLPNSGATVKAGQVVNVTVSTGIEAKKEVAKATPKPTATAKPKPKPSPSPKSETGTEKEGAGKPSVGEKAVGAAGTVVREAGKAKTSPTLKISPKPSPKKPDGN